MRHSFRICHLDPLRIWTDLHISFTAVHYLFCIWNRRSCLTPTLVRLKVPNQANVWVEKNFKWVGCESRTEGLGNSPNWCNETVFHPTKGWMCCPWNNEFHPGIWLKGHTAMKEKIESEISQWLTSEESTFKILKGIWLEIHCVYPLGLLNSAW